VWRDRPKIPGLERLRQEDVKIEVMLRYILRPSLKKKRMKEKK
jgi:hypothetical protein